MTISSELQNTVDWIAGFALRREPLNHLAAAALTRTLLDLADRAKQLERLPVDDASLAPCEVTHDAC
jgi:hypothetical protein